MFLKTYRLKSSAALKGSEAKKLRARVELAFPHISAENLLPAKANVTQLKILTHGGVPSVVYCVDKLPMFFELDGGQLVPTLYALWSTHDLLPYFTTHEGVLPKLSNGADLMLPGVVPLGVGLSMYGHFKKGQLSMLCTFKCFSICISHIVHFSGNQLDQQQLCRWGWSADAFQRRSVHVWRTWRGR